MPGVCPCVIPVLSPPGSFSKGVAEGEVDPSFGPLEAIRLSIQTDSPVWIILSEVSRAPSPAGCHRAPALLLLIPALSAHRFSSRRRSDPACGRMDGHTWILSCSLLSRSLLPGRLARVQGQRSRPQPSGIAIPGLSCGARTSPAPGEEQNQTNPGIRSRG